jgi:hypothetical protein
MTPASSGDHEALGPSQEPAIDTASFMIVVLTAFSSHARERWKISLLIPCHAEIRGVSSSVLA